MKIWEILKHENVGKVFIDNKQCRWYVDNKTYGGILELKREYDNSMITDSLYLEEILELEFTAAVDWSDIPMDTKIYVRDKQGDVWKPRLFAKYENDKVHAWLDGKSSFTIDKETDYVAWEYAKLAE